MPHSRQTAVITAASTEKVIEAAVEASEGIGVPMCIAITCPSGTLAGFLRMDGAALLSIDIAINKAYTAVSFGMATHAWHEFIKDDPPLLHGIVQTPRLVTFGGGYPIKEDGQIIGGIGISGGHYSQDMDVATKALAKLGFAVD